MIKPWRIGPNGYLSRVAWMGAGLETVAFNFTSETMLIGMFQILLFASLLCLWIAMVWLVWFFSRLELRLPTQLQRIYYVTFRLALWIFISLYGLSWIIHGRIKIFPDAHWIGFLRSSFGVLFYEVQRASNPWLISFYIFCVGALVDVVFTKRKMLNSVWSDYSIGKAVSVSGGVFALCAVLAVVSLTKINNDPADTWRPTELTKISTSVNPVFAFATSLIANRHDNIAPDLDVTQFEPIVSDAELYANVTPTTNTKSILYLAVESLRSDVIFKVWQGKEITPNLNALARRSMYFTNMYAQASHTDYALPAFLSSQYPLRSQEHYYYQRKEPWPKVLLYDHLSHFGYRPAIISSDTTNWGQLRNYLWSPKLDVFFDAENLPPKYDPAGSNRGYVTNFKDTPRTDIKSVPDRETVDFDMQWIKNVMDAGQPYFLHTFFYQPHYPYTIGKDVPRPFQPSDMNFDSTFLWFPEAKIDNLRNAYCNAVHETDAQIGRLLKYLDGEGQTSNTIIVITADHGEAFNEHGFPSHAGPLFNEVVHIPCIIFDADRQPGMIDYPAQQIDIAPTVCGLLNIPPHPGFQGIDVLSKNRPLLKDRDLYLTAEPPGSWRGDVIIAGGRWKFWNDRMDDQHMLFDLENDPGETADVKTRQPLIAKELKEKLLKWRGDQLSYYTFKTYYDNYYPPDK